MIPLCLALLAGPVFALAPAAPRPAAATVAEPAPIVPAALSSSLRPPPESTLDARFRAALGQVEAKLVRLVAATPLLLLAMGIVLLAAWLGGMLSRRGHWLRLRSSNPYMDGLVRRIVQTAIVLVGVVVALDLLGATSLIGAVLGSAGLAGLVLGFAFKDIAENYISGVLLSLRQPFAPGDHIVIDAHEGKVVALDSRATTLMTFDGVQVRLPNALVFKSVVRNYSANPKRRFDFTFTIDTGNSIDRAQALALEAIGGVDGVLTDPGPSSLVQDHTPGGVSLQFFGWIDQYSSDLGKVRSESIRLVKAAYARSGLHAPRPITHVVITRTTEPRSGTPEEQQPGVPGEGRGADTTVNRDLDQQLAAAQRASGPENLLDPSGDQT